MPQTATGLIQQAAPFALIALAGLCAAITLLRARALKGRPQSSSGPAFGTWPDAKDPSPQITRRAEFLPGSTSRRVTSGPALANERATAGPLFFQKETPRGTQA